MTNSVPFQKWRLFWFSLRHAYRAGFYRESDPHRYQAHFLLAKLGTVALQAAKRDEQAEFLRTFDRITQEFDQKKTTNTNESQDQEPDWVKKYRK